MSHPQGAPVGERLRPKQPDSGGAQHGPSRGRVATSASCYVIRANSYDRYVTRPGTWGRGAGSGQRHSNFDRNIKTSAHHSYTSGLRASGLQRLRVLLPLSQKPPMKGHGLVSPPASHDWDSAPLGSRVSGGGAVTRQPWCRSDASTRLP